MDKHKNIGLILSFIFVALLGVRGFVYGISLWDLGGLAYVLLMLFLMMRMTEGNEKEPHLDRGPSQSSEEIILRIIRENGRARRRDFMPHLDMSKSTLVRMLDKMEADGLIVQIGERKATFYQVTVLK